MPQIDQLFRFLAAGSLVVAPWALPPDSNSAFYAGAALVIGFFLHQVWFFLFENIFDLHLVGWTHLAVLAKQLPAQDLRLAFDVWQQWIFGSGQQTYSERMRGRLLLLHSFGTVLLGAVGGSFALALHDPGEPVRTTLSLIYISLAAVSFWRMRIVFNELDRFGAFLATAELRHILGASPALIEPVPVTGRRRLVWVSALLVWLTAAAVLTQLLPCVVLRGPPIDSGRIAVELALLAALVSSAIGLLRTSDREVLPSARYMERVTASRDSARDRSPEATTATSVGQVTADLDELGPGPTGDT